MDPGAKVFLDSDDLSDLTMLMGTGSNRFVAVLQRARPSAGPSALSVRPLVVARQLPDRFVTRARSCSPDGGARAVPDGGRAPSPVVR